MPSVTLNMALVAPMPSPVARIAEPASAGLRRSMRRVNFRLPARLMIHLRRHRRHEVTWLKHPTGSHGAGGGHHPSPGEVGHQTIDHVPQKFAHFIAEALLRDR